MKTITFNEVEAQIKEVEKNISANAEERAGQIVNKCANDFKNSVVEKLMLGWTLEIAYRFSIQKIVFDLKKDIGLYQGDKDSYIVPNKFFFDFVKSNGWLLKHESGTTYFTKPE